jgi:adenosylmethionine-8-amino-7-oxononanoate aminotransferase
MDKKRTEELTRKDVAHFVRPATKIGQAPRLIWEKGDGALIWDTNGDQFIDVSSGGAQCANLGYARKELNDAAYLQMQNMSHIYSGGPNSNIQAIECATELAEILPGDINHVYFTSTGSHANEVAIQMARAYWETKDADRYKIICLARAYHGGTALTRSLGNIGMECFGRQYPGIVRIPNYHCYRCAFGLKYPSCNIECARFLETVINQEGAGTVAAFIAEPVQGVAGLVWPPDEYWPLVRKICTEHNVLYIDDEVMAGFCRTGKWFAIDHWDVVPDILTMGKGINSNYLPLGAVGISDGVYEALSGKRFMGVATSDAHPVCVATARAALKIYTEEGLAKQSAELGEHMRQRLAGEFLPLPCVDDVMGRGLFQSFEIALNKTTRSKVSPEEAAKVKDQIFTQLLERGIFTAPFDGYPHRQVIGPPCIITKDQLDAALDTMLKVMKEVKPV